MYGNPSYMESSYGVPLLGHDATQGDLTAIKYQMDMAESTGPISGQQAFLQAQGEYYEGMRDDAEHFLAGSRRR